MGLISRVSSRTYRRKMPLPSKSLLWFNCDVNNESNETNIKIGNVGKAAVNRILESLKKLIHINTVQQVKLDIFNTKVQQNNNSHNRMQVKQFVYDPQTMRTITKSEASFFINQVLAVQLKAKYMFPSSRPNLCLCFRGGKLIFVHDFLVQESLYFIKKEWAFQIDKNKSDDDGLDDGGENTVNSLDMDKYCEEAVRILLSYCYTGVLSCPPSNLKAVNSLIKECRNYELSYAFRELKIGQRRMFEEVEDEDEEERGNKETETQVNFEPENSNFDNLNDTQPETDVFEPEEPEEAIN